MLAKSDTPFEQFLPYFAKASVPVAFLVTTDTGYEKSIMDATGSVRQLLLDAGIHNYEKQEQGPENKVKIATYFVNYSDLTKSGKPTVELEKVIQLLQILGMDLFVERR